MRRTIGFTLIYLLLSGCKDNGVGSCADCNFLTCRVNGQAFAPRSTGLSQSVLSSSVYGGKRLDVGANNLETKEYIGIGLIPTDSLRVGTTYRMADYPPGTGTYKDGFGREYRTNSRYTGEWVITRLEYGINSVMEGTFQFEGVDSLTKQQVSVTDGRFRLLFYRYP